MFCIYGKITFPFWYRDCDCLKKSLASSDFAHKISCQFFFFIMLDILGSIAWVCALLLLIFFFQNKLNRNCRYLKSIAKEIDHFTWQSVLKNTQQNKIIAWKVTRCKNQRAAFKSVDYNFFLFLFLK